MKCFSSAARMVRYRDFGTWPGAENAFADHARLFGIHFTRGGEFHGREYYVEIASLKQFTERRAVLVQEADGEDPDPTCKLQKWL